MDDILGGIVTFFGGIVLLCCVIYGMYKLMGCYSKRTKASKDRRLAVQNIMSIINKLPDSIVDGVINTKEQSIDLRTFTGFIKAYRTMDHDQDINLVIHTPGGALGSVEAIVNCIVNHKGAGRFIAYIPYYAYSGGMAIALACHEIRMTVHSIVGPCDGQLSTKSVAAILETVREKRDRGETIAEKWLALYHSASLCQNRQRIFVDKLVDHLILTREVGDRIYEEFFTGKYNHDMSFSATDLTNFGLNVTLIETIPPEIADLFQDII